MKVVSILLATMSILILSSILTNIIPIMADYDFDWNKIPKKYVICGQNMNKLAPPMMQDDHKLLVGHVISCAYGFYNYNIDISSPSVSMVEN